MDGNGHKCGQNMFMKGYPGFFRVQFAPAVIQHVDTTHSVETERCVYEYEIVY